MPFDNLYEELNQHIYKLSQENENPAQDPVAQYNTLAAAIGRAYPAFSIDENIGPKNIEAQIYKIAASEITSTHGDKLQPADKEVKTAELTYLICAHYNIDTSSSLLSFIAEIPKVQAELQEISEQAADIITSIDINIAALQIDEQTIKNNGIKEISKADLTKMLEAFDKGEDRQYTAAIVQDGNKWIAIDDNSGQCFTEEFNDKKIALAWLTGAFEMGDLSPTLYKQLTQTPEEPNSIKLQNAIDNAIAHSTDFNAFTDSMKAAGYEVEQKGKYLAYKGEGQSQYHRGETLGEKYSTEAVKRRIKGRPVELLRPISEQEFYKAITKGETSFINCYFSGMSFTPQAGKFEGLDFAGSRFMDCNFQGNIGQCDFSNATINGDFQAAALPGSTFDHATIYGTRIIDCNMQNCTFSGASFRHVSINETNLAGADLAGAELDSVYFRNAEVSGLKNANTISITMGGATADEVANHKRQIMEALTSPPAPAKQPIKEKMEAAKEKAQAQKTDRPEHKERGIEHGAGR